MRLSGFAFLDSCYFSMTHIREMMLKVDISEFSTSIHQGDIIKNSLQSY